MNSASKQCFFLDRIRDHGATLRMCSLTLTPCHYSDNISRCDCAVPNYVIFLRIASLLGCSDLCDKV